MHHPILNWQGGGVKITEEVAMTAARNVGNGGKIMELLLNWLGAKIDITLDVTKAAAGSVGNGREVMERFLR